MKARPRQIMPRRLEVVLEKLDLAIESFEPHSEPWRELQVCRSKIKSLLSQLLAEKTGS